MNKEKVILVDEQDREIGTMEKMEAHRNPRLHRAISVFIVNSKGEWLLQQRALGKYHSNGLWSNTCCSHPRPGETSHEAAIRRLHEEMGMQADLKELFHFIYREELDNNLSEFELDHVFVGISESIPNINPNEVLSWKYISFPELKKNVEKNPENYTVWFKKIMDEVNQRLTN